MPIQAYDVRAKEKVTMVPDTIVAYRYKDPRTDKYRYRLAAESAEGNKLSRFVTEAVAKKYGPIKDAQPKRRKTCEQIRDDAYDRCVSYKTAREEKAASRRSAAAAKRAAARKAKKPAAKKTTKRKTATKRKPKVPPKPKRYARKK